jgi:hypothetical protein
LKGIVLDGDLGDWPKGIKQYPITVSNGQGKNNRRVATGLIGTDPASHFSVGYDPDDQRIYVAVVVRDPKPVVDHTDPWHTDSVEIFIDGLRTDRTLPLKPGEGWWHDLKAEEMPALQYVGIPDPGAVYGWKGGDNPALMYGDIRKTKTAMAWSRKDGVITYEWAIEAFDSYPDEPSRLEPGKRIGFDIAVLDQNYPKASLPGTTPTNEMLPTYTTWSHWSGVYKGCDAGSLGELIISGSR